MQNWTVGQGFCQIKVARELPCVRGDATGSLEPLQPELHLQGQWSLCVVDREIFLLGEKRGFQVTEIQ